MAKIDRDEVLRVAKLTKLRLSDAEVAKMTNELSRILEHVDRMGKLDVANVEPTAHAVDMGTPFREDARAPGVSREDALGGAPATEAGAFAVPRILAE